MDLMGFMDSTRSHLYLLLCLLSHQSSPYPLCSSHTSFSSSTEPCFLPLLHIYVFPLARKHFFTFCHQESTSLPSINSSPIHLSVLSSIIASTEIPPEISKPLLSQNTVLFIKLYLTYFILFLKILNTACTDYLFNENKVLSPFVSSVFPSS